MTYTPTTATIKEAIQHNLPPAMAAEALRIFNRWYSAELAEAREEGRQAALAEQGKPDTGYVLFRGDYEYYSDFDVAIQIMEERAEFGQEYYTLLSVYPSRSAHDSDDFTEVIEREDALGLSVHPPTVHAARASNLE